MRRVSVSVPLERAEEARARFLELAPEGFEEATAHGELELAAYLDEAREAAVRAAFERVATTTVEPGWEDAWRRFHRPVRIGPLWVGPPWETPHPGSLPVVIDPGRAFGTGSHATTRLCLELLLRLEPGALLDVGSGSGVLAVAAVRLGFAPVTALDVDPAAVEATRANAAANGADVTVGQADALAGPLPEADVAVANIERAAVEALDARLAAETLVASGYLERDPPPSLSRWRHVERLARDGWAADRFARR